MTAIVRTLVEGWVGAADWRWVSITSYCGNDKADLAPDDSIVLRAPASAYFVQRLLQPLPNGTVELGKRVQRIQYGDAG